MPIYMIGEDGGEGAPFNRTFFNATLGGLLERAGKPGAYKLTLFLTDGETMEVCHIDELTERYMVVRAYTSDVEACDMTMNVIPYGLIYRLELEPKEEGEKRVGFRWIPAPLAKPYGSFPAPLKGAPAPSKVAASDTSAAPTPKTSEPPKKSAK